MSGKQGKAEDINLVPTQSKQKIYFSRTYRHLRSNINGTVLFMIFFVLLMLIGMLFLVGPYTNLISKVAINVVSEYFPNQGFGIYTDDFAHLFSISYVCLPTKYPSMLTIYVHLAISFVLILVCSIKKIKSKPLTMYVFINSIILFMNSLYFLFAAKDFPIKATMYSELYIKQEVGIWLAFVLLAGLCTILVGNSGYIYKMITVVAIVAYSLLFGAVRYVVYMFALMWGSIIYVAMMFFVVGPLLDFLYFVIIYAFFVNKMVKKLDSEAERGSWEWL